MALSTTKETTNFARICRLLVDGGALALRNVFDSIHSPSTLQTALNGHSSTLQMLKKKGILNPSQWNLLFPPSPACASSANFDTTLLALLLRTLSGLTAPAKGWNDLPLATDTNVEDDIARIKFYRNKVFAHASRARLTDVDFAYFWSQIRDALVRLGGNAAEIDQLKSAPIDHEAERCIKSLEQWCLHEEGIEEIKKLNRSVKGVKGDVKRAAKRISDEVEEVAQKVMKFGGKMEEIGKKVKGIGGKMDEVKEDLKEVKDQLEEVKLRKSVASQGHSEDATSSADSSKEELVRKIESLLKAKYKRREEVYISPFPWCEEWQFSLETIFTKVQMISRDTERYGELREKDVCDIYEIFKPHEKCPDPRVVLLEGDPGIGKTVCCKKIAFDWSKDKTGEPFPRFKILIKLKCRDINPRALIGADILKEAIADQLLPIDVQPELKSALFDYIRDPQSRVLLVLDGMDELQDKIDLSPMIKGDLLSWPCKLLLTSRNDPKLRKQCDSLFQIIGFTIKDAKSYIRKFFEKDEEKSKVLLERIDQPYSQDGELVRELVSSPLNASLLCAVCDGTNGKLPSSTTQLYEEIIYFILTRYYVKKGQEPPDDPMATHEEDLAALSRLALKGINSGLLYFHEDAFRAESRATNILEFGFLSKETKASISSIRLRSSYQFLHKTLQEFFAASALYNQLLSGNFSCFSYLPNRKHKQLTLFIVGLLSKRPEASEVVVSLISRVTQSVSNSDSEDSFLYVCNLVRECVSNVELEQAMCAAVVEDFTLERLDLWHCGTSESSVEMRIVCEALRRNRPLRWLHLMHNEIKDVTLLAQSMLNNHTLAALGLSRNPFVYITPLIQSLKNNTTLKHLWLRGNKFSDEAALEELQKQKPSLGISYP